MFFNLNHSGETAERMFKLRFKKILQKLIAQYKTTKMLIFMEIKDKISFASQSTIVYKFTQPGCGSN